jgi:LysM repeat protein
MQNTRSKSTTSAVYGRPSSAGWGIPATAGSVAPQAPQLRLVPGRIALFLIVLATVAMFLVPRMVSLVSSASEPRTHVVESGETLWAVAGEFGDGGDPRAYVDELLEINRLSSPQVFPGQTLILP